MSRKLLLTLLLLLFGPVPWERRLQAAWQERAESEGKQPGFNKKGSPRRDLSQLSPEERGKLRRNAERWKKMDPAERQLMRDRLSRWQQMKKSVDEELPEDERRELARKPETEKRRVLDQRTREMLRRRLERMPPEVRRQLQRDLLSLEPSERKRRANEIIQKDIAQRVLRHLKNLRQRDLISKEDLQELQQSFAGKPARERAEILRRWMIERPESFEVPDEVLERLERSREPRSGSRALREFHRAEREAAPRIRQFLQDKKVPETEIEELFQGSPEKFRFELRRLMRRHGLRMPPAERPFPGSAPLQRGRNRVEPPLERRHRPPAESPQSGGFRRT